MMPSYHDLSYFQEVTLTLNLSRAAERLGISQPSLTLAIQRLEGCVGAPLLIRSKKGVTLTQAGKQLHMHLRDLLQRWDVVKSQALASMDHVQGSYTLGCHPSVALYSLGEFLPHLLESYPKLEIRLVHDLSRRILERVISMDIDIGIVVNPTRHPDLVIQKLCDDEVTFWVGPSGREMQSLRSGEALILCDPNLTQVQTLLKGLKKKGMEYKRIVDSSSLEVIAQLTAKGAGVGILPSRVAALAHPIKLNRVDKAPTYWDEIALIYRVENKYVRTVQVIAESVKKAFKAAGLEQTKSFLN